MSYLLESQSELGGAIGADEVRVRSPDAGGLRFVLYWGNRFSYPPDSATPDL